MTNRAVAVGTYTVGGVFEHTVWKPGDSLTDPDGNPIGGGSTSGFTDFIDDPTYWEHLPYNKYEAVQDLGLMLARHLNRPLTPGVGSGTGIPFNDKTPEVWNPMPSYLIDAIQYLSYEAFTHFGIQIPCAGTGANDPLYTDNPAYWTTVPLTYLEAIQCIAAFLYGQLGYEVPCRSSDHDYVDDPTIWNFVPFSKVHAVRSIAAELATHIGAATLSVGGLDSGPPYNDTVSLWTPGVPGTIDNAVRSIATAFATHLGAPIACPKYNSYAYRGDWPFVDSPANWTNVPKTVLQAIQSIALELSTHFAFPLAALGIVTTSGDGVYVSPPVSSSSPGNRGEWSFDGTYLYKCVTTNTWVRFVVVTSF